MTTAEPEPKIIQWHVTWSTKGRWPLAPDEPRRRALVRALVERVSARLVLFSLVDDHVHLWLIGDSAQLTAAVRSLHFIFASLPGVTMQRPYIEVVEQRSHAESLVSYFLRQTTHHNIDVHPLEWAGAAVPDLVGARILGAWKAPVWKLLPRLRVGDIHAVLGLPDTPLVPASNSELHDLGPERLLVASAATFAAGPSLARRDTECVVAIAAAAHLAREVGLQLKEIAMLVDRSREAVSRAATRPIADAALNAVRLRVALDRAAVGAVVASPTTLKDRLAHRRERPPSRTSPNPDAAPPA